MPPALETRNFIKNDKTVVLSAEVLTHLPDQYVDQSKLTKPNGAPNSRGKKKSLFQGIEPCKLPV